MKTNGARANQIAPLSLPSRSLIKGKRPKSLISAPTVIPTVQRDEFRHMNIKSKVSLQAEPTTTPFSDVIIERQNVPTEIKESSKVDLTDVSTIISTKDVNPEQSQLMTNPTLTATTVISPSTNLETIATLINDSPRNLIFSLV